MVRLHPPLLTNVDDWAKHQPDKPSRPEAIRRLLKLGLSVGGTPQRRLAEETACMDSDFPTREVELVSDRSASTDEQARRNRALIRGSKELRDVRSDLPINTRR
jgi:hypothetical protein